ncbi:MAG: hypothetical protein ACOYU3_09920 [Bacillota bacterium]
MEKVKIEVFGLKGQAAGGGGCGPGCGPAGCGPQLTMGEMFDILEEFIEASDIKDKVELRFIDLFEEDIDGYADVSKAISRGFMIPLTAIDGKLRFHRGISNELIYEAVAEKLTSQGEQ